MVDKTTETKVKGTAKAVKAVLAKPFLALAEAGEAVEAVAGRLLRSIRDAGISDEDEFDIAYKAACHANGWNSRAGKPSKRVKERRAVPHTVRTYAWEIRAGFRAGINVGKCDSMHDLRMKRAKEKAGRVETTGEAGEQFIPENLKDRFFAGVTLRSTGHFNGALWHDAMLIHVKLPEAAQAMFERQIGGIVGHYRDKLPADVRTALTPVEAVEPTPTVEELGHKPAEAPKGNGRRRKAAAA